MSDINTKHCTLIPPVLPPVCSTLLMMIPEEPEYMLLWPSDCEWNKLDGREVGLDLIIGDFGEM